MKYDTIIVGGGVAGLTAAAYLTRAGQSVALFEKQEKAGGLVQSFERNGVLFDAGLRSIENSGIVFPMLKQLGIELEFIQSKVSVGIADQVLVLKDRESVKDYEAFLSSQFPDHQKDVQGIIREIQKIMGYMDVLYGVDNPAFMDIPQNRKYLFRELLPWLFKFLLTIRKINRLNEPVEEYLKQFTQNQALIDMIAQHFFQRTPASFALGYFNLYLDYHYPLGGTAVLIDKLVGFIQQHGGIIHTSSTIESLHPEKKYLLDGRGNRLEYDQLIWAADLKQLYQRIPLEELTDRALAEKIEQKRAELQDLQGGDSVFTAYYTVELDKEYFENICTGHFFYTPSKKGLSTVSKEGLERFLNAQGNLSEDARLKETVKNYLREFCALNTFEIAIPALRDPALAPKGRSGLVVSLLFDYRLARKIEEAGWTPEMKDFLEQCFIDILDRSIFPGLKGKIAERFSSTPLTIEKRTLSTHGAITGWAFTTPHMPAVNRMMQVAKSVETVLPSIYQAGQWVYSPSGLPISILTGKLAADRVLKKRK
jgi:phytoene dehydrogenase-like protein